MCRGAAASARSANDVARSVLTIVLRDLVLDREDVVELAVVALRPEQLAVIGGGELRRDRAAARPSAARFPRARTRQSSSAPIARTSCGLPLSANTDVRDATRRPSTLASASISSSVMPSLRYSFSGSGLALTNGSTAMLRVARR